MTFLLVHDDPGIPLGESDDPLAGLSRPEGKVLFAVLAEKKLPRIRFGSADHLTIRITHPDHPGVIVGDGNGVDHFFYLKGGELVYDGVGGDVDFNTGEAGWADYPFAQRRMEGVDEGKAIGSAGLGGDVGVRDLALRQQARGNVSMHIRQASRNANRDLREVYALVEDQIGQLLVDWLDGKIRIAKLREGTSGVWSQAYERTREIGRKASGIARLHPQSEVLSEEETWFRGAVREELRYWNLFLEEMLRDRRARRFDESRMWERFANYVKALRFMYEATRVQALPDNLLFYWMGPQDVRSQKGRICEGCAWMTEHSPFTKDTLPAVPRDGSTACLTNCRHRLVVRVAQPIDVERRRRLLENRPVLVRQLQRLKERSHGTWRQVRAREVARAVAPHVSNPFRGLRLPDNPPMLRGVPRPDERRSMTEAELMGPIPLDRRLKRIEEAIQTNMPMRHLDLYYAARQLESQLRAGRISRAGVQPILDRFVGALEATVLAASGRNDAQRFESAMRSAIGRLWQAVEAAGLSESDSALVLGAAAGAI